MLRPCVLAMRSPAVGNYVSSEMVENLKILFKDRLETDKELKDFILEIFAKQSALTDKKIEEAADRVRHIFVDEILKAVNVSRKTARQLNQAEDDGQKPDSESERFNENQDRSISS